MCLLARVCSFEKKNIESYFQHIGTAPLKQAHIDKPQQCKTALRTAVQRKTGALLGHPWRDGNDFRDAFSPNSFQKKLSTNILLS